MNSKMMHVYSDRCTGCKNCELACAFSHAMGNTPSPSRITILPERIDGHERGTVVICMQCENAACLDVCPPGALFRDPDTGAVYHDASLCIRCGSCTAACPFGNMKSNPLTGYPIKCDLCGGDPVCVKFCPAKAIEFK